MAGGSKSKECREKVALALASGQTVAEAAAGAHVSERQVHRWLSDDTDFNLLLHSIHEEVLEESISLLVEAQRRAARRLLRLLGDRNKRIALGAVKVALEWQERLTALVQKRLEDHREAKFEEGINEARAKNPAAFEKGDELMELLKRATGQKNGKR